MKTRKSDLLVLILSCLFAGTQPILADSEPRWVHIPDNPEALLRHFGMEDLNCYTLSHPDEAVRLGVTDLKAFNRNYPDFKVGTKRTNYDIDVDITFDGKQAYTIGQCFTSDNRIKCGGSCDTARYQFYDVDLDTIILEVEWISKPCGDDESSHYDPSIYGRLFSLSRMDEAACAAMLAPTFEN